MKETEDPLAFLLRLNLQLADTEANGEDLTAPGLPGFISAPDNFITTDCIHTSTL